MIIKFLKIVAIVTLIGTPLAFFIFWLVIKVKKYEAKEYFGTIKNKSQFYCYDLYHKVLNPSFYVDNLQDAKELEQYYERVEKGENPPLTFPPKFVVLFKKVYNVGYPIKNDSQITEFVDFDTVCYGYVHGYTFSKNLFINLPDSTYLKRYREKTDSLQNTFENRQVRNMQKLSSPYGIQCDCNW